MLIADYAITPELSQLLSPLAFDIISPYLFAFMSFSDDCH
jgi:hypothetical protein